MSFDRSIFLAQPLSCSTQTPCTSSSPNIESAHASHPFFVLCSFSSRLFTPLLSPYPTSETCSPIALLSGISARSPALQRHCPRAIAGLSGRRPVAAVSRARSVPSRVNDAHSHLSCQRRRSKGSHTKFHVAIVLPDCRFRGHITPSPPVLATAFRGGGGLEVSCHLHCSFVWPVGLDAQRCGDCYSIVLKFPSSGEYGDMNRGCWDPLQTQKGTKRAYKTLYTREVTVMTSLERAKACALHLKFRHTESRGFLPLKHRKSNIKLCIPGSLSISISI